MAKFDLENHKVMIDAAMEALFMDIAACIRECSQDDVTLEETDETGEYLEDLMDDDNLCRYFDRYVNEEHLSKIKARVNSREE